jgi:release factor glutamine methyltransferase
MPLPTLMELLQKSATFLVGKGIANGRREAEWIFTDSLHLSRLDLYTRFDMPLEEVDVDHLRERVQRRGRREPLAYILGTQPFHGLELQVGPGVLVPRPETEELIDLVLAALPSTPARVLDIGTGSGAIALACKQARPDCTVEAVDISQDALTIARANGEHLGLSVDWRVADLLAGSSGVFDAIIANLPYIGTTEQADCDPELAYEPPEALYADADGLREIRRLIDQVTPFLTPQGACWLEHGWKQSEAIRGLAEAAGLVATAHRDGAEHERFACIRLA